MEYINLTAGDLRTRIRVQKNHPTRETGQIVKTDCWLDIGNTLTSQPPRYRYAQWIGSHGSEAITDAVLSSTQSATVRLRYHSDITPDCRVLLGEDIWHITSVDDIRQAHQWMEISLERTVAG